MKLSSVGVLLVTAVLLPFSVLSQSALPRMTSVEPTEGKAGTVIAVTGENLEKSNVAEIYFTDGKNDLKLQVLEQTATSVKVRVPAGCKPGRWALMILTAGKDPKLIEQPVKFTVQ
jgi:hypothetical protein